MKVLLLEDDAALAMGIVYSLKNEGYEVEHIKSYAEGVKWLDMNKSNASEIVALFDVMLPDGNGFDMLRAFQAQGVDIPVLFLTAVSDEVNVVQGLDLGADDYITKPFRVKELISRLNAVCRRYYRQKDTVKIDEACTTAGESKEKDGVFRYRDLSINTRTAIVMRTSDIGESINIELTPGEYKMLLYFIDNQGIVLERSRILERLFDSNGAFIDDNTLSVYIKRLREKIGDIDRNAPYIKTVRGVGYMMEKENA